MLIFTLAISCLTTSNLAWFMDLTFQVPMQYCSLQHQTFLPSPVTSTTGCFVFFFWLWLHLFILSGIIAPLFPSSTLGSYWPGRFISVSYLFAFSYGSRGSQGKNTELVCHSLLQQTMLFFFFLIKEYQDWNLGHTRWLELTWWLRW